MNTQSELTQDIENSIKMAYDTHLSMRERELIREHLAYVLTRMDHPNVLIDRIQAALSFMAERTIPWYQRPIGLILVGVAVAILSSVITRMIGCAN